MSKKINKSELRRNEILSVAQNMFYQHGYENTSVNMIIDALGISKGAFYHYFKSKEDLLDQLADKFTLEILVKLNKILEDNSLNAIEKLNQVYLQSGIYKAERFDFLLTMMRAVYDDNNIFLRYKFNRKSLESSLPLMTIILEQGKEEGLFKIENPQVSARMIQLFGISVATDNARLILQCDDPDKFNEVLAQLNGYQKAVERILGAPENSIRIFSETFLEALQNYVLSRK